MNDWVPQQYLPAKLIGTQYFQPKGNSKIEKGFKKQYETLHELQKQGLK